MQPIVGIFIPAYNAAPFLDKAINSVLGQTMSDLQLLVLDDASQDNTGQVAQSYLTDPRISYIRNETNLGMAANWNKGLSLLEYKYIAKLDADDYYQPDYLREMVAVMEENPSVGLSFSGVEWITGKHSRVNLPYTESWVADGRLFRSNLLRQFTTQSATIFVRGECYQKLDGFVPEMRIHTDWEMWTRIASNYDVAYLNKPLASMFRHGQSCTAQSLRDTRTPDDFTLWLKLLDENTLPYQLDEEDRETLEVAMIRIVRGLLCKSIGGGAYETAAACAEFLIKRPTVPWYERMRYKRIARCLTNEPQNCMHLLRGTRWTQKLWPLDKWLAINMPAPNPQAALP